MSIEIDAERAPDIDAWAANIALKLAGEALA
jgi:hypothetical protein